MKNYKIWLFIHKIIYCILDFIILEFSQFEVSLCYFFPSVLSIFFDLVSYRDEAEIIMLSN